MRNLKPDAPLLLFLAFYFLFSFFTLLPQTFETLGSCIRKKEGFCDQFWGFGEPSILTAICLSLFAVSYLVAVGFTVLKNKHLLVTTLFIFFIEFLLRMPIVVYHLLITQEMLGFQTPLNGIVSSPVITLGNVFENTIVVLVVWSLWKREVLR